MTRRHPVAGGALRVHDTESESLFVPEQTGHGAERGRLRTRARRITHHSKSADPGEELHKLYWILALGPSSGVWLLETELRMRSYPSLKRDVDSDCAYARSIARLHELEACES